MCVIALSTQSRHLLCPSYCVLNKYRWCTWWTPPRFSIFLDTFVIGASSQEYLSLTLYKVLHFFSDIQIYLYIYNSLCVNIIELSHHNIRDLTSSDIIPIIDGKCVSKKGWVQQLQRYNDGKGKQLQNKTKQKDLSYEHFCKILRTKIHLPRLSCRLQILFWNFFFILLNLRKKKNRKGNIL